jgi:hypothetical protein
MKTKFTTAAITAAGHSEEDAPAILALCAFIDCEPSDLGRETYDHYGLALYSLGSKSYAIGTDDEANKACEQYCEGSVWAFNASFILEQCGLPCELEDAIRAFQEDKCEGANDALLALVEKCCKGHAGASGIEAFTEDAISADGRGHFLSGYDGEENEEVGEDDDGEKTTFFIYRTN